MNLRRLATTASTVLVAIIVALAVPVSQLRTFSIESTCCCPDPSHCHCPHQSDHGGQPSMGQCHKTSHEAISPDAPAAAVPELAIASEAPRVTVRPVWTIAEPHASPAPTRPDAPS